MSGSDATQERLFRYVTPADFVPKANPSRPIREIVNTALREMDGTFAAMYAPSGWDSNPPEQLLRSLILEEVHGLRSARLLCEYIGYNLLNRCLGGPTLESAPWNHSTHLKNRDRLIEHQVSRELFESLLEQARRSCCPPPSTSRSMESRFAPGPRSPASYRRMVRGWPPRLPRPLGYALTQFTCSLTTAKAS